MERRNPDDPRRPVTDPLDSLLRHRPAIRRLAARLVGAVDADDVVQETYLRALRRPPHGDARAWLTRIATNVVRFRGRTEARRRARETAAASTRTGHAPSTDAVLVELEASERVGRALRALPEPYRTTLIQRFFLGWTTEEIAAAEQIGTDAIRQRQKRGLDRLRTALARADGDRPGLADSDLRRAFGLPLAGPFVLDPRAATPQTMTTAASWSAGTSLLTSTLAMKIPSKLVVLAVALLGTALFGTWRLTTGADASHEPASSAAASRQASVDHTQDITPDPAPQRTDVAAPPAAMATQPHASLRVTAVWSDNDAPAIGVTVLVGTIDGDTTQRGVTDAAGVATFSGLPAGAFRIGGPFRSALPLPTVTLDPQGPTAEVALRLEPGASVSGRVVDRAGTGIAAARVVAADWAGFWSQEVAITDADGTFRVDDLPTNASIGATAEGHIASRLRQLTLGARSATEVEIALAPSSTTVRVHVVDPDGAPIPDARAALGPFGRQLNPEVGARGDYELVVPNVQRTDAAGRASLGGVGAGTTALEVRAPGFAGWIGSVVVDATTPAVVDVEVRVGPDIELTGTALDGTGSPLAEVFVEHGRHGHLVHDTTDTDSTGRYVLRGLPAGEASVHAQHSGRDLFAKLPTVAGRRTQWDPRFGEDRMLDGRVRLADGSPVDHAEIRASGLDTTWHGSAFSTDDGTFRLPMKRDVQALRIRVALPGSFERVVYSGPVPAPPLELVLGPEFEISATITGHLVDAAGTPVVNAHVWYGLDGQGNSYQGDVDESGTFSIDVAPGTYRLRIEASGFAVHRITAAVDARGTNDLGALQLAPPTAIRVVCAPGRTPPAEVDFWVTERATGARQRLTVRDGVGELGALTPGDYRLQVVGGGLASALHDITLDAARPQPQALELDPLPGVPLEFAIALPDAEPNPRLLKLQVRDAAGHLVVDHGVTRLASGELYGAIALAPGTYEFTLDGDGLHGATTLAVAAGGAEPVRVAIRLQR